MLSTGFDSIPTNVVWMETVAFQILRVLAGVAFITRQVIAIYLFLLVLVWSLVSTIFAYISSDSLLDEFVIAYFAINFGTMAAVFCYSYWLRSKCYYVVNKRA